MEAHVEDIQMRRRARLIRVDFEFLWEGEEPVLEVEKAAIEEGLSFLDRLESFGCVTNDKGVCVSRRGVISLQYFEETYRLFRILSKI